MTIRALLDKGLLPFEPRASRSHEVSIMFAFDWAYLHLFKTAIASLAYSSNFLDSPLVVYTDDRRVLEDKLVQLCADKLVLLEGAKKALLHTLAENHVKRPERAEWNKGTFLKWMIFEQQPTDMALFLDVDMIFNEKFDDMLMQVCDRPFNAVPQFKPHLYKRSDDTLLDKSTCFKNFSKALDAHYTGAMLTNINSGLIFLRKEMLSDDFFREITDFAVAQGKSVNEQVKFTEYFKRYPRKLRLLSCSYNFQELFLQRVSNDDARALLKRIHVLHFAGGGKPWTKLPDIAKDSTRLTQGLWHWHRTLAQPLFSFD